MLLAMLALPIAMQAQTKFHDVEMNEAKGAVKSISTSLMGREQVTTFDENGKMHREGLTDVVYDAEGYLQSAKMEVQGQQLGFSCKWENGVLNSQTMNMMGQDMTISYTYNEKGAPASQAMDFGGQKMESPYTDYKYDDHGNWISRKASMMGQEMEQTRTITYYE